MWMMSMKLRAIYSPTARIIDDEGYHDVVVPLDPIGRASSCLSFL
jgi:hypothetical protein